MAHDIAADPRLDPRLKAMLMGLTAEVPGFPQTETRSHTKIRVSPGAIACPAPRSP